LPFPDNTFDMVTALDFVEHINNEEYEKLIVEIKRVLKPNGTLCIYTPNKTYFLEYIYKIVFGPGHRPQHFGLKTIPELLAPLAQHGYEVAHLSTQANYVPVLRQVEQVLMHLPVVGQLFKRRVSIRATKRA
jgi:ubiquinone/menaquinone biosynthesis C-methylase UbiE